MRLLYRNYRPPGGGEVDLICREKDTLVFAEVKTRHGDEFGTPGEAIDQEKTELILRGALSWLRLLGNPDIHFRFDVVEVLILENEKIEITHLRDALDLPGSFRYSPQTRDPGSRTD